MPSTANSPYVRAMTLPLWPDPPFEVPEGLECRKGGDLAALIRVGTDRCVGFVPSRFDPARIGELIGLLDMQP